MRERWMIRGAIAAAIAVLASGTVQAADPSVSEGLRAAFSRLAVVELDSASDGADPQAFWLAAVEAGGGAARVLFDRWAWVDLPPGVETVLAAQPGVRGIRHETWPGPYASVEEESVARLLGLLRSGAVFDPPPAEAQTPGSDALGIEDLGEGQGGGLSVCGTWDYNAWPPESDEFLGRTHIMQGRIVANFFLLESDANGPENVFDWDGAETSLATTEIQEALAWWSIVASIFGHNATFILQLHGPQAYECQVPGEASLHASDWLWTNLLPVTMGRLGFPGWASWCTTGRFNESTIGNNDRAFSGFIFDGNNYFTDGRFAYAFLNGPFLVSLRRPDQWGTNYLNLVTQHEMGHIFRACDEYEGGCASCSPCIEGAVPNYNCEVSCPSNAECIMRANENDCCGWSRQMVGLLDNYAPPTLRSPLGGAVIPSAEVTLELNHVFGVPRYDIGVDFRPTFGLGFFYQETTSDEATYELPDGTYWWHARSKDRDANYSVYSTTESFRINRPPFAPSETAALLTASNDDRCPPWIRLFEADGAGTQTSFLTFQQENGSGSMAAVAAGDLDGAWEEEILVSRRGSGSNFGVVRVHRRNRDLVSELTLFDFDVESLELAAGDVDGDGTDEIVAAPFRRSPEGDYIVGVFRGDGSPVQELIPFGTEGRSGCRVACGDVDGDGIEEILAAEAAGTSQRIVRVLRLDGSLVAEISPFPGEHGGLMLAAADVDGDGADEIVAAPGRSEPDANRVRVVRLDGTLVVELLPDTHEQVSVAGGDVDFDGVDEVVAGVWPDAGDAPEVWVFDGSGALESRFVAYALRSIRGISVAVMERPVVTAVNGGSAPSSGPSAGAGSLLAIEALFPNPLERGGAEVRFRAPAARAPRVDVIDAAGRSVRALEAREMGGGLFRALWDGKTASAVSAPQGIYWIRVRAGGMEASRQVTVLR